MVRRGRGSFHAATAGAVWVVGEGAVVETRVPGRRVDVPQRRSWALVVATSVVCCCCCNCYQCYWYSHRHWRSRAEAEIPPRGQLGTPRSSSWLLLPTMQRSSLRATQGTISLAEVRDSCSSLCSIVPTSQHTTKAPSGFPRENLSRDSSDEVDTYNVMPKLGWLVR